MIWMKCSPSFVFPSLLHYQQARWKRMTMLDWIRLLSAFHCPADILPFLVRDTRLKSNERGLEKDALQRCLYITSGMCMLAGLTSSGGRVRRIRRTPHWPTRIGRFACGRYSDQGKYTLVCDLVESQPT
jgi:hypothetical protein